MAEAGAEQLRQDVDRIDILQQDARALAAELKGEPLHVPGTARHDLPPDLRRAGEHDLANRRVVDQALTDN